MQKIISSIILIIIQVWRTNRIAKQTECLEQDTQHTTSQITRKIWEHWYESQTVRDCSVNQLEMWGRKTKQRLMPRSLNLYNQLHIAMWYTQSIKKGGRKNSFNVRHFPHHFPYFSDFKFIGVHFMKYKEAQIRKFQPVGYRYDTGNLVSYNKMKSWHFLEVVWLI